MLTGTKPFPGDDVSQTLARVIDREPDWDALPTRMPAGLQTVLRRCLEKDPKRRIRDIGDVGLALEGAFETPAPSAPEAPSYTRSVTPRDRGQPPHGSDRSSHTARPIPGCDRR